MCVYAYAVVAELSAYIRDHLANRAFSIGYLAPYRKNLLTSGLNHNQKQGQFAGQAMGGGGVCFLFLALDFFHKYHTFVFGAFQTLWVTAVCESLHLVLRHK